MSILMTVQRYLQAHSFFDSCGDIAVEGESKWRESRDACFGSELKHSSDSILESFVNRDT